MEQPEGQRDPEGRDGRDLAGVPGDDRGQGDGGGDGDLDPGSRGRHDPGPDQGERGGVTEGEGQRASEGGADRAGAQEQREHEQGMVPALGNDVPEAPSSEVHRRRIPRARRAGEGDGVRPLARAHRDELEAVGREPQPCHRGAEQGVQADAAGGDARGRPSVEADQRHHRVRNLARLVPRQRTEVVDDRTLHEAKRQAPSVHLDRDQEG